jgi:hypothetical protein
MTKLPIKEITQRFSSEVQKKFDFLVDDYGFTYQGLEKRDFNYGRDARVSETYLGEGVGVRITWWIGDSKISVSLYELQGGKIPDKASFYGDDGYSRAINLHSFLEMLHSKNLLPKSVPERLTNIAGGKNIDKRTEMIRTRVDRILEALAAAVTEFGSEILQGDTSIFPEVQTYHRQLYGH